MDQGAKIDQLAQVLHYHQETKHHFFRYARALGYLDWKNQPDPFRRYAGAPLVPLPILNPDAEPLSPSYEAIYQPRPVPSRPVSVPSLSRFFEYALAISAWKQAGETRWALRANPSSGNLHPTEGYLLIGSIPRLAPSPGLYHYAPKEHALERRADWSDEEFARLMSPFPRHAFLFGLTSVHWREAWKYGERAFRYCQHDAGHAIGAARIAAATLGWRVIVLDGTADDTVAAVLGVNRNDDVEGAEREHPDCLAVVWPADIAGSLPEQTHRTMPLFLEPGAAGDAARRKWHGRANRLSLDEPVPWEIIDEVAAASWKSGTERTVIELSPARPALRRGEDNGGDGGKSGQGPSAGQIIRQRRSALAFDGKTSITAGSLFRTFGRVMPRVERPIAERPMPWDAIPWEPTIHLAVFVHRVEGLRPGLYLLVRDPAQVDTLRKAMHESFDWAVPPGCPPDLPLFLLQEGDASQLAAQVSCHQAIAGDSAFALGMIADFEAALRRHGPWFYRRLFWETGMIGQVLYLEAEAEEVRATGIGCFFDDPMHQVLGLKDTAFQSLYHFTTGGHVEDPRLTTLPAYANSDG
ncbi:MAG: SagB/ThcOx family dehydrogenase [Nitrospiraceae bacterium]